MRHAGTAACRTFLVRVERVRESIAIARRASGRTGIPDVFHVWTARIGFLLRLPHAITVNAAKCHLVPHLVRDTREMSLGRVRLLLRDPHAGVPASRAERDAAALRAADDGSVDSAVEAGELHDAAGAVARQPVRIAEPAGHRGRVLPEAVVDLRMPARYDRAGCRVRREPGS